MCLSEFLRADRLDDRVYRGAKEGQSSGVQNAKWESWHEGWTLLVHICIACGHVLTAEN